MAKTIVFLTTNKYPNGDAGAIRQHQMAKIFNYHGYDSFVIGYGNNSEYIQEFEGVRYISLRKKTTTVLGRVLSRVSFAKRAVSIVENLDDVGAIILTDGFPDLFSCSLKYAKKKKLPILHDSVEWYSPEEYKYGIFSIEYLMKEYTNRIAVKHPVKVISISEYLERYFSSKGLATIRIPVIMEVQGKTPSPKKDNVRDIFVYAGAPVKKDYIDIMLKGFSQLSKENKRKIEIHIFGINEQQLISVCGVDRNIIDELGDCLFAHGRVSHDEATEWVKKADATILLRDEKLRYAQAGFPTKVVESMMYGTPVICNISSDLGKYLKNAQNAYIVDACDANSFCSTIMEFIDTDKTKRTAINKNARYTAEKCFDRKIYLDALVSFTFSKAD